VLAGRDPPNVSSPGNMVGIRQVENVDHGSHDMPQLRSGLTKRLGDRGDCVGHLLVGVTVAEGGPSFPETKT
jgi:hypothetical protein